MAHASEVMLKVGDAKTRIIPGHGPLASKDDLKATHEMLSAVTQRLEKMIDAFIAPRESGARTMRVEAEPRV